MKEYKSNEELLEHLISKNIVINNKKDALKKIEKYTYYSIVNSYKMTFKNSDGNYKDNVTFDEIYALYNFDKNIKYLFLKYTLEIEIQIKALMANHISKVYGIQDYLKESSLDDSVDFDIKNSLIERINKEIEADYKVHSAITHYKDKYGFVPPFVLTKILTLGVVSSYYGLLKQSDRQAIAKHFKISDRLLKQILKNITMIRNISAHNDRLFCFRSKYYLSFKDIDKKYKRKDNETNLYMVMTSMKFFLNDDFDILLKDFFVEVNILKLGLSSVNIEDILNIMGFPMDKIELNGI
jgi:abortive infection bacteriophage resistance protein